MMRRTSDVGPLDIEIRSPQGDRNLILEYCGEVRFGPPFFLLWIQAGDEYVGPGETEIYGDKAFWSTDGRYLALERWYSLELPNNGLMILDLRTARRCLLERLGTGFLKDVTWRQDEAGDQWTIMYWTDQYRRDNGVVRKLEEATISKELDWMAVDWLHVT